MNYNTENRTPRDRLSDELFFKEYATEYSRPQRNNCPCKQQNHNNCHPEVKSYVKTRVPASNECGGGTCIDELPLVMVYSPMQQWRELFDAELALKHGTLFKELVLPFYPTPCNNNCGRDNR